MFKKNQRVLILTELTEDLTEDGMGVCVLARKGEILIVRDTTLEGKIAHVSHVGVIDRTFTLSKNEVQILQGTVEQIASFEMFAKDRGINLSLTANLRNRYAFAVADHAFEAWCSSPGYK